jgi:hypothetical protein
MHRIEVKASKGLSSDDIDSDGALEFEFHLSNGRKVSIELHERIDGTLSIRTDRSLEILPRSSNNIYIRPN